MLAATGLLLLAGLAWAEPQAAKTTAKATATAAAPAAAATTATTASDFQWVSPAVGSSVTWNSTQNQVVTWTGTTPATFDLYLTNLNNQVRLYLTALNDLTNPNHQIMPYVKWMPIAQNVPMSWHNITFSMVFGPGTGWQLFATNHQAQLFTNGRGPSFTVTGGNGKFLGFPLASSYMASWQPSTTLSVPAGAAAPIVAGATTSAAAGGAPVQAIVAAGTTSSGASSSVSATGKPNSAHQTAVSGLATGLIALLTIALCQ